MRSLPEAQNQFSYHPATAETAPKHAAVRDAYRAFLDELWDVVPDGPEKTLALRALQESQMYANLAIALTAPADEGQTRGVARVLPEGGPAREYPVRDVEGPLERNEHAFRGEPILQIPVVVHIDNRQVLMRPGLWSVPQLRLKLGVAENLDLRTVDWHLRRIPLHVSDDMVSVHDGQRFETTSRRPALADATQAPAVTEVLAQSGVVRVTVDGHGFITARGEWGVVELREEMGILPDRSLWLAERDGVGRTHLHRNETVVVQAGQAFFTTPEQPPAAARYLPADDAS